MKTNNRKPTTMTLTEAARIILQSLWSAFLENTEGDELSLWRYVLGHMDSEDWWSDFGACGEQEKAAAAFARHDTFDQLQAHVVKEMLQSNSTLLK